MGKLVQRYGKLEWFVVGAWGEGSKDLHSLVKTISDTKVSAMARALGREASDKELGLVVTQVRKYLSVAFVGAQSLCLVNWLGFIGEGAKAAAGRRELIKKLEEGRKPERQAHFLAHVRGQSVPPTNQK